MVVKRIARLLLGGKALGLIVFVAIVAIGAGGCLSASNEGSVRWTSDSKKALAEAQAQHKPIMIFIYTDLCPACRQLERTTYSDEELSSFLNANFINLRSDAGRTALHTAYGIWAVPTIVFSAPDGYEAKYEIARIVGYKNAEDYYRLALDALERWQP